MVNRLPRLQPPNVTRHAIYLHTYANACKTNIQLTAPKWISRLLLQFHHPNQTQFTYLPLQQLSFSLFWVNQIIENDINFVSEQWFIHWLKSFELFSLYFGLDCLTNWRVERMWITEQDSWNWALIFGRKPGEFLFVEINESKNGLSQ